MQYVQYFPRFSYSLWLNMKNSDNIGYIVDGTVR